jgi:hypothetical protein
MAQARRLSVHSAKTSTVDHRASRRAQLSTVGGLDLSDVSFMGAL